MSENPIHISNTPIFDQLVQEFAARGKRYETLVNGGPKIRLAPAKFYVPPGAWIAKTIRNVKNQTVRLSDNVHPMDTEAHGGWDVFLQDRLKEFRTKHPSATDIIVSTKKEEDDTVTLLIEGIEAPELVMASPANAVSTDEPHPQTSAIPRPLWISDEEIADEE